MGGVWTDPSNLPDGAGVGRGAAHSQLSIKRHPEAPGAVSWNGKGGDDGPFKKESANMNPAGRKAEISWRSDGSSYLI